MIKCYAKAIEFDRRNFNLPNQIAMTATRVDARNKAFLRKHVKPAQLLRHEGFATPAQNWAIDVLKACGCKVPAEWRKLAQLNSKARGAR